jgi:hypothetical protein
MQAFVAMRKFIATKAEVFQRLARVEGKQLETDNKFEQLFDAIESKEIRPKQGIFFDGQVFDAYSFVAGLIRSGRDINCSDRQLYRRYRFDPFCKTPKRRVTHHRHQNRCKAVEAGYQEIE